MTGGNFSRIRDDQAAMAELIAAILRGAEDLTPDYERLNGHSGIARQLVDAVHTGSPTDVHYLLGPLFQAEPALRYGVSQLLSATAVVTPGPTTTLGRFHTPEELMALKVIPPLFNEYGVLIPDKAITLLAGESGVGKSFFACDIALRLVNYHLKHIIYVTSEKWQTYGVRLKAWKQHYQLMNLKEPAIYDSPINLMIASEVDSWIKYAQDSVGTAVHAIFIDTLAPCLAGGDENSSQDIGIALTNLNRIKANFDCAIILVHHTGKNVSNGPRGSYRLIADVDTVIMALRGKEKNTFKLQNPKQSNAEEFPDVVMQRILIDLGETDSIGNPITSCVVVPIAVEAGYVEVPDDGLSAELISVLAILNEIQEAQFMEIVQLLGKDKKEKGTVGTWLRKLRDAYLVMQPGRGRYQITDTGRKILNGLTQACSTPSSSSESSENGTSEQSNLQNRPGE